MCSISWHILTRILCTCKHNMFHQSSTDPAENGRVGWKRWEDDTTVVTYVCVLCYFVIRGQSAHGQRSLLVQYASYCEKQAVPLTDIQSVTIAHSTHILNTTNVKAQNKLRKHQFTLHKITENILHLWPSEEHRVEIHFFKIIWLTKHSNTLSGHSLLFLSQAW